MTLEGYVKFFNEKLYPLNYPYKIRVGLRSSSEDKRLSLIVSIGIPKEQHATFYIDEPTEFNFQDLLTIYGKSDEEVIERFMNIDFDESHKEYFRKLWNK